MDKFLDLYTTIVSQPPAEYPEYPQIMQNYKKLTENERSASVGQSIKKDVDDQMKEFNRRTFEAHTKNIVEMERCYQFIHDNPDLDTFKSDQIRKRIRRHVETIEPKLKLSTKFPAAIGLYVYIRQKFKDPTITWTMTEFQKAFI